MSSAQLAVLVVAIILAVGFLGLTLFVSKRRKEVAEQVRSRFGDRLVLLDDRARCYGVESRGTGALQAMGCLALSRDTLLFVQWSPRDEVELDRRHPRARRNTRHLGQDRRTDLLRVRFRNPDATWAPDGSDGADGADKADGADGADGADDTAPEDRPGAGLDPGVDAVAFQVDDLDAWRDALQATTAT